MTKRYSIFLTILFCVYIGGMLAVSLLLPKQNFSQLENRYLEQAPALSLKSLQSGQFMQKGERYLADHIAGRDLWVALKAWCERLSGKRENNGVYFAAGGSLITRVNDPDPDALLENVEHFNALVANVSVPTYLGLIPSAAAIWADRLPAGAPTADELAAIKLLYDAADTSTIDFAAALAAHHNELLYYRTDHHWTSLGAYYGANALLSAMKLEPLQPEGWQKTTVSRQFYGTAFSASGVRWLSPDTIETYIPDTDLSVTSYFGAAPAQGALYVDSFLQEKDKYSYFLGGNQSLCIIETGLTNAPSVLLIRDSYADCLAPFLTRRFSQIHLLDLRYNLTGIKDYVTQHDIDAVVVLYSFPNFMAGNNLFALGR